MKRLFFIVCFFSLQNTAFANEPISPVLVKSPGSFQIASDNQKLVDFNKMVSDCFRHSTQFKGNSVDSNRIYRIINQRIDSSDNPPVIQCQELVSAYMADIKE